MKIQSNYRGYEARKKISKTNKQNEEILDDISPESEDVYEPEEDIPSIRPISGKSQSNVDETDGGLKELSRPATVRESPIERNISGKTINGTNSPDNTIPRTATRENSRVASRSSSKASCKSESKANSKAESRTSSRVKSRTESLVPTPPESNSRPESRRSLHSSSPESKTNRSHANSVSHSRVESVRPPSEQSVRSISRHSIRADSVHSERVASIHSNRQPSSGKISREPSRQASVSSRHSPSGNVDDNDLDTGKVEEEETESKYIVNQPKDETD